MVMGGPLTTNTGSDQLTLPLGTASDDSCGLDVDDPPADPSPATYRPVSKSDPITLDDVGF
jgi:hypothetical protein